MDESILGVMALGMSDTNTGGGGYIGGDANARTFTGRDDGRSGYSNVEVNLNKDSGGYQSAHPLSVVGRLEELEKAVALLKQDMYGNAPSGIAGVIRNQFKQMQLSQANMGLNIITLIIVALYAMSNW
jgi:hypothetical protein